MKRFIILFLLVFIFIPLFSLSLSDLPNDDFVVSVVKILDNASQTGSFSLEENDSNKDTEGINDVVPLDDKENAIAEEETAKTENKEGNLPEVEQQVNETNQVLSSEDLKAEEQNVESHKDLHSQLKEVNLLDNETDKIFSAQLSLSLSGKFRFYSYEMPRFINTDFILNFVPLNNYFFLSADFDYVYYGSFMGKVKSNYYSLNGSLNSGLFFKNRSAFTPFVFGKASYLLYNNNNESKLFTTIGGGLEIRIYKALNLTLVASYIFADNNPWHYRVGATIDII